MQLAPSVSAGANLPTDEPMRRQPWLTFRHLSPPDGQPWPTFGDSAAGRLPVDNI